jgi:hypothetical protein
MRLARRTHLTRPYPGPDDRRCGAKPRNIIRNTLGMHVLHSEGLEGLERGGRTWADRVEHASNGQEVLALLEGYAASLDVRVLARLPLKYAPPRSFTKHDEVSAFAYDLQRGREDLLDRDALALVEHMARVYSAASARLAQLGVYGLRDMLLRYAQESEERT